MLKLFWPLRTRQCLYVLLFALTACSLTETLYRDYPQYSQATAVVKSENDRRDYRYLVLPNQLKVLLVSDPQADKAAASLNVHVGSGSDPVEYQGLAHFLEHMLFLGTEKYPEAGEYQAFISDHGGNHNAYTAFDQTNYFFDIDPAYLEPTLDRFAQFFIAPLFTEQYVDREKNAVHSEFMSKIKDDQRKSLDVFKALVNPQHPFAKFSVGNLETLAVAEGKPPLREQLLAFHDQYYSAGIMSLVVLGKESLPVLETMVRQKFSAIPNNGYRVATIEQPLFPEKAAPDLNTAAGQLKPAYPLPQFVTIQPEKQQRTLSIAFPTGDELAVYRQKPLQYIGNILGHEGQGSLLSWLKDKGWAEGLAAGTGLSYSGGSTFNITIKLTREGVPHVDDVVAALFQAINRIRQTPDQQWLYEEQKQLAEQSFRYQESMAPIQYVMNLSSGMEHYAPEDTLRGPYVMDSFDRALIDRYLSDLVPANSLVTLTAPGITADQSSPYYHTAYHVAPPSAEQLRHWNTAGVNDGIRLPAPNPFIAQHLALKSSEFNAEERDIYDAEIPKLIQQGPGFKLWYKPDNEFLLPKGSVLVGVHSPVAGDSAEHHALLKMFTALVSDQLNELSYPATLAGLGYDIAPDSRGFVIRLNGFDDKQLLLLDEILSAIDVADFDARRFENIKREQIRHLENVIKEQPYRRVIDSLSTLLYRDQYSTEALLKAYQSITQQQLADYQQRLLSETDLNILVHGNYRKSEAELISTKLRQVLLHKPHATEPVNIARLSEDQSVFPVHSDYADAALLLYMQAGNMEKVNRAALGLTAQILRSDFYTQLRTEKQLGYIVTSGAFPVRDVPGIFFLVQSPVVGAGAIQQEIKHYLKAQLAVADAMTDEQFERQRNALIVRLSEQPKNLWERADLYWQNIGQHYFQFDMKQQLIVALESLTLEQWKSLFRQQLTTMHRAMWIYARGKFDDESRITGKRVENLNAFKQSVPYYQLP